MLVLTRRIGEVVIIDKDIRVTVVSIKGDKVRLGICAPDTVRVDREEIHARRQADVDALPPLEVTVTVP